MTKILKYLLYYVKGVWPRPIHCYDSSDAPSEFARQLNFRPCRCKDEVEIAAIDQGFQQRKCHARNASELVRALAPMVHQHDVLHSDVTFQTTSKPKGPIPNECSLLILLAFMYE